MGERDHEGDRATDDELVELFSLEDVEELRATASHHPNGDMSHQTCGGEWLKRTGRREWTFVEYAE